jgi:hypothetical protein
MGFGQSEPISPKRAARISLLVHDMKLAERRFGKHFADAYRVRFDEYFSVKQIQSVIRKMHNNAVFGHVDPPPHICYELTGALVRSRYRIGHRRSKGMT